jgi:hypothetical protein
MKRKFLVQRALPPRQRRQNNDGIGCVVVVFEIGNNC